MLKGWRRFVLYWNPSSIFLFLPSYLRNNLRWCFTTALNLKFNLLMTKILSWQLLSQCGNHKVLLFKVVCVTQDDFTRLVELMLKGWRRFVLYWKPTSIFLSALIPKEQIKMVLHYRMKFNLLMTKIMSWQLLSPCGNHKVLLFKVVCDTQDDFTRLVDLMLKGWRRFVLYWKPTSIFLSTLIPKEQLKMVLHYRILDSEFNLLMTKIMSWQLLSPCGNHKVLLFKVICVTQDDFTSFVELMLKGWRRFVLYWKATSVFLSALIPKEQLKMVLHYRMKFNLLMTKIMSWQLLSPCGNHKVLLFKLVCDTQDDFTRFVGLMLKGWRRFVLYWKPTSIFLCQPLYLRNNLRWCFPTAFWTRSLTYWWQRSCHDSYSLHVVIIKSFCYLKSSATHKMTSLGSWGLMLKGWRRFVLYWKPSCIFLCQPLYLRNNLRWCFTTAFWTRSLTYWWQRSCHDSYSLHVVIIKSFCYLKSSATHKMTSLGSWG